MRASHTDTFLPQPASRPRTQNVTKHPQTAHQDFGGLPVQQALELWEKQKSLDRSATLTGFAMVAAAVALVGAAIAWLLRN